MRACRVYAPDVSACMGLPVSARLDKYSARVRVCGEIGCAPPLAIQPGLCFERED